ncbi:DUF4159 domain-containing protein [Aliiroseovarius crassostreae]|uniref:DUF4159 domain-containing protein n=1 Tax=Aliiroseovarius crassostreae TaxID=154981 RepID=UPI002201E108|nr:DUF4159 domain-containing protein [Aliiroseovarius crassostreae]UWQ08573.1 DUF4159 domain-containing protein [Aliiroseovarius crassostreae]
MGALGFASPWLLLALLGLPALWWLLRAIPPAPIRRRFPAVTLLIGLSDQRVEARKMPLWLLLLRLLALALVIIGLAGPVLSPDKPRSAEGPLIVVIDSFWPAAADWAQRVAAVDKILQQAEQTGQVALIALSDQETLPALAPAAFWRERLATMTPVPWDGAYPLSTLAALPEGHMVWISDGVARSGRGEALALREARGTVEVMQPERTVLALAPAVLDGNEVHLRALRIPAGPSLSAKLRAFGRDPMGQLRLLHSEDVAFVAGNKQATIRLTLPPELRHRVQRFEVSEEGAGASMGRSAGQVSLVGEGLTRRRVALLGAQDSETLALLRPDHFLRAALEPTTEIVEAQRLEDALRASPHVIILPDVPSIPEPDQRALAEFVAEGGLLLRFAGPRLATAKGARRVEELLLPVRLRGSGRAVGGAMSWGAPQHLAPFPADGPFAGLRLPEDVSVRRQVLAEPGPDLAERVLARLSDGTPLVTRKLIGAGQVVLFHVGADAEWSNLVLSGLFVEMLERLTSATATQPLTSQQGDPQDLQTSLWQMDVALNAFGQLESKQPPLVINGQEMALALSGKVGRNTPPGLYVSDARQSVINAVSSDTELLPAIWPSRIVPHWGGEAGSREFAGQVLLVAFLLILLDGIATLWVSGRIFGQTPVRAAVRDVPRVFILTVILSGATLMAVPDRARAQGAGADEADGGKVARAAAEVTLAHVLTGDAELDRLAQAGLTGLSEALFARSSVEPATPVGVDLEQDELSVFPLLYWPISEQQPLPSASAYDRLAQYLATGGLILFDTRDAGLGGGGAETRKLQDLAAPLSLPPLDPIPPDHVLTRSFYLIDSFPGRHSGPVWAEAASRGAEQVEGMPFRLLNDGVTPVIIGGNDWAGAWAIHPDGRPILPVGRGYAGERQREMALRFGINLVMHVLTGNYKSDQVHVPALLQRLGQ